MTNRFELKSHFARFLSARNPRCSDAIKEEYVDEFIEIVTALEDSGFAFDNVKSQLTAAFAKNNDRTILGLLCEIGIAGHFLRKSPLDFDYQVINPRTVTHDSRPKTFDFSFKSESVQFNVEVKSFAPAAVPPADDSLPIKLFMTRTQSQPFYDSGLPAERTHAMPLTNLLKDANAQLSRPQNGASVVILCCNDADQFADSLECFWGRNGILSTNDPARVDPNDRAAKVDELDSIDAVVVCMSAFQHQLILTGPAGRTQVIEPEELASGAFAWRYDATIPVGFFLRPSNTDDGKIREVFSRSFLSYLPYLFAPDGQPVKATLQEAVFDLINASFNVRI